MSDVRELLAEATPLPWTYRAVADAYLYGDGDFPPSPINLDLAVYAVNHLPDYLAAVEALERLVDESARTVTEPRRFHENEDDRQQALGHVVAVARAALACLRDEVTA